MHSRSKYHFNNFGGLVLFSLPPKRFCFLLCGTQRTRRYITRYVWVSRDVGGACTGRLKSLGLALFSGAASPNQKSRHHDMKTGKGTRSSGVFTSVIGLFSIMWQERPCLCSWRPFLTSAPALSLANTCVEFPVHYQHRCSNSRACSYGWARQHSSKQAAHFTRIKLCAGLQISCMGAPLGGKYGR